MKILLLFITTIIFFIESIKSQARIHDPNVLAAKYPEGMKINIATFGDVPYGMSIFGAVYYDINNVDAEMACKPITTINIPAGRLFNEKYPIVMLDRGSCSFVTKARNAQRINAELALIINNNDDDIADLYMIDDGTGKDIRIPTVIISKKDGENIKKYIKENSQAQIGGADMVHLNVEFNVERTEVVYFETLMSSTSLEIYEIMQKLGHVLVDFPSDKLHFFPAYYTESHPDYNSDIKENTINSEDCFGNGKYCHFIDIQSLNLNVKNGRDVLLENLRQVCIFRSGPLEINRNITFYVNYMNEFFETCLNITTPNFSSKCSEKAMSYIGMSSKDISNINNCVTKSFTKQDETEWGYSQNDILSREKKFQSRLKVAINPSIVVNRKLIYGRKSVHNILEAICVSFKEAPETCFTYGIFATYNQDTSEGFSTQVVIFIILAVIALNILIVCICRFYMKRKMRSRMEGDSLDDKISSAVTSYMALKDKH